MQLKNKMTKRDRARIQQRQEAMQMVLVKRTIVKDKNSGKKTSKVFLSLCDGAFKLHITP